MQEIKGKEERKGDMKLDYSSFREKRIKREAGKYHGM